MLSVLALPCSSQALVAFCDSLESCVCVKELQQIQFWPSRPGSFIFISQQLGLLSNTPAPYPEAIPENYPEINLSRLFSGEVKFRENNKQQYISPSCVFFSCSALLPSQLSSKWPTRCTVMDAESQDFTLMHHNYDSNWSWWFVAFFLKHFVPFVFCLWQNVFECKNILSNKK